MSDSDEPNINNLAEQIEAQLEALTARLERITVAFDQRLGALEELSIENTETRETAAAARQVSPPRVLAPTANGRVRGRTIASGSTTDGRVQGRTVASGRSSRSRRRARPITETFVIGDDVYLFDKKQETTHYGTVIGFTRVGWAKILLESGSETIRKTNNITKNFRRP